VTGWRAGQNEQALDDDILTDDGFGNFGAEFLVTRRDRWAWDGAGGSREAECGLAET